MNDQAKTPGAMVLVPREADAEIQFAIEEAIGLGYCEADIWTAAIATAENAMAEQTPAVGWEPRHLTEPEIHEIDGNCIMQIEFAQAIESEVRGRCRAHVAPLQAEIQRSTARELLQLAEIEHLTKRAAELEAQQGEPAAYADPKAFDNFKSGIATHEWMWAFPDNGLQLYRQAQPATSYLSEIAEALGDETLTSLSQVATGIRDLQERIAKTNDWSHLKPSMDPRKP